LFGDLEVHTANNVSAAQMSLQKAEQEEGDEDFVEEDEFEGLAGDYSRVSVQKEAYVYKSESSERQPSLNGSKLLEQDVS